MLIKREICGVCAKEVSVIVNGGVCGGCSFLGGCDGQGKSINALIAGMPVSWVIERLKGIQCGKRESSCAAELAKVLEEVAENENL